MMSINLLRFRESSESPDGVENILETGNTNRVLQHIVTVSNGRGVVVSQESLEQRIEMLLNCIAQARSTHKVFSLQCNGVFTHELFAEVEGRKNVAQLVIKVMKNMCLFEIDSFRFEKESMLYLSKPRYVNGVRLFYGTRYSHHLNASVAGKFALMSKAAAYILGGASLIALGENSLAAPDGRTPYSRDNVRGWTLITAGSGFIVSPFISAAFKCRENQP